MGRSYIDGGRDAGTTDLGYPLVAVCIDKDKNSQNALKWAIDSLVQKGQTIVLVHVNTKGTSGEHHPSSPCHDVTKFSSSASLPCF